MAFWKRKRKGKRDRETPNARTVLIRQIVFGVLLVVLVVLLGTGIWYGTRIKALTIENVEVIGGETINHDRIEEIAEESLKGTYYRLVPRAFAWTYPRHEIENRISEVERIKNVHVERTARKQLSVVFEEYHPFALWCQPADEGGLALDSACLFLDRNGYAFAYAPKLDGGAFVRFSEHGRMPEIKTEGFPGDFVRTTESFIKQAYDEVGINIIQVEKSGEDEVTYHIAGGGELKTTLRMMPEETIENLEVVLSSEEFGHIEPGNFQYIDLRYGNKIFVNEELEAATGTEEYTDTATTTEDN